MNPERKPSLPWALLTFLLPISCILYGTVFIGLRPPVIPLIIAIALATLLCLPIGYKWSELEEGMFNAVKRILIAVAILLLVGMLIAAWIASGTIPGLIYWGLRLIAPEHFLVSALLLCSVASIATGTSFGTMGTLGVALLGIGNALGFPPAMTVGAVVSGAYIGDKMSPISDSTNITASICEVPLFSHIYSMLWTTVPAFILSGLVYYFLGSSHSAGLPDTLESIQAILAGLENGFNITWVVFIPPVLLVVLAFLRFPVVPVMFVCIIAALIISFTDGTSAQKLGQFLTTGYKSGTGVAQLDSLLSRGGILSVMPTVLLLICGVAFGGVLEKARVLEVLLDALLKGARSAVRLVASVLLSSYIINLGTGSQMLAVIVPGRAFLKPFADADIDAKVLSRTCEDGGTIGCPLIPWSVHAFYILGILEVSALQFGPYAILNWSVPIFSILCAATGIGVWRRNGTPVRKKAAEPLPQTAGAGE